jgi:calcium-dependent protein kinase
VADFGLSAKYEQQSDTEQVGTLIFMSPEVIKKKLYKPEVDVFAIGIILYMLLTGGEHPLFKSNDFSTERYKKQLLELTEFQFPDHLSPLAANLFHRLTKFSYKMRYSAYEALKHPWITRLNKTLIPMTL